MNIGIVKDLNPLCNHNHTLTLSMLVSCTTIVHVVHTLYLLAWLHTLASVCMYVIKHHY